MWKCDKSNKGKYPPWFKLNIDFALWRNDVGRLGAEDENSAQTLNFKTDEALDLDC